MKALKANPNYYKEYSRQWREAHPDYLKEHSGRQRGLSYKKYREQVKIRVLTYYGNSKCACVICGESRLACLSIDHIGGNGAKHRREPGVYSPLYGWLIKNNYPKGYQTLCMNCQFVKRLMNNECNRRQSN